MPKLSAIGSLPEDERAWIDKEISARNFADYDGLVEWLQKMGFEISRSAAARHGAKLKKKLQAVKDSTEAARLITEAAPDDDDLRSAAVISLVQSELFSVMVTLQDLDDADPAERVGLLKEAARSVLDMTKASTMQKKWMQENEARIRKQALEAAAQRVDDAARAQGLDVEQARFWREKVLMGV